MSPERPGIPDTVGRFDDRVEHYARYRPRYPASLLAWLEEACGWTARWHVADIGSGTGILSEAFLDAGNRVTGIEPNREMRNVGERLLAARPQFISRHGTAERTGLRDGAVDAVVAGQAAHWFDLDRARAEFKRILVPCGWVMLVWNERPVCDDRFLHDYDALLRVHGVDYATVERLRPDEAALRRFLGGRSFRSNTLPNRQTLDARGLAGRILSSSYAPGPGHPKHEPMMRAIDALFATHQRDGVVTLSYDCNAYVGDLED